MKITKSAFIFISTLLACNISLTAQDLLPSHQSALERISKAGNFDTFEDANIFLEQNFTDGDAEVVIQVKGGDEGLKRLWIIGPDGTMISNFKAGNGTLGGREFVIESPEPDLATVIASFPEGEYLFIGRTFSNDWLVGFDELSHALPTPATITAPEEDSTVPSGGLQVSWDAVPGTTLYLVEVDNEDLDIGMAIQVPSDLTTLAAPPELIFPGTEYKVAIGTFNEEGNLTFVEVAFVTADP